MKRRFLTNDVFTQTRFGGNPLAVVLDAEGLDDAAMQAIAREFNYSETTFVLPPADPAHTANVRIFTVAGELPFAGHPNVGTAFALASLGRVFGRSIADRVLFEEKAGLVPVRLWMEGGVAAGAQLTTPQALQTGAEFPATQVARCLGLAVTDIVTSRHAPVVASVGTPFLIVELSDREALRRIRADAEGFAVLPPEAQKILAYVRGVAGQVDCRMFFPIPFIAEDPATGSANAALAGLLARLAGNTGGTQHLRITQGEDMGRPSLLLTEVDDPAGAVRIGGHCVAVMEGLLDA